MTEEGKAESTSKALNKINAYAKAKNTHELFQIKIYEGKNRKLITKLNFLLFKCYEIKPKNAINSNFVINTKENFNFFEALNSQNFRLCQMARMIKDTLLVGNNIMLISLPISLKYIVLIHDMLNYVKMRKTRISPQKIGSLSRQFSNLSLGSKTDISNKENFSYLNNTNTNTKHIPVVNDDSKNNLRLDVSRLMKIQNKKNIVQFLQSLNNNY